MKISSFETHKVPLPFILCHTSIIFSILLDLFLNETVTQGVLLFTLGYTIIFLSLAISLLIFPKVKRIPSQSIFSMIFFILYLETCVSHGNFMKFWVCGLCHLIILKIEAFNSFDATFPLLGLYYILKHHNPAEVVFQITFFFMMIGYSSVNYQGIKQIKGNNNILNEKDLELAEYKNLFFEEIQCQFISITLNNQKKLSQGKFFNLIHKFKKIVRTKKETKKQAKSEFFSDFHAYKSSSELISTYGDITQSNEKFYSFLKSCEIVEKISTIPEIIPNNPLNKKTKENYNIQKNNIILTENSKIVQNSNNLLDLLKNKNNFEKKETYEVLLSQQSNALINIFKMKNEIIILIKMNEKVNENISLNKFLQEENKNLKDEIILKDKILASVSHDMRTPLNGIMFYLKTAKESENTFLRNQRLDYALVNSNLLLFMVNDLLEFTVNRQNGMRMSLKLSKFALQTTVDDVLDCLKVDSKNKNIELLVQIQCNQGLTLINDESRFKRVLINLLSNALKFTVDGYVKLKITQLHDQNNNLLKIEVIDTGLGIHPNVLPKLMTPFATFDNDEFKVNKNGIGLGLFISKSIVQMLGPNEEIFIYSELGVGSKFCFLLDIINDGKRDHSLKEISVDSKNIFFTKELERFEEENCIQSDARDLNIKTRNISAQAIYNKRKSLIIQNNTYRTQKSKSFTSKKCISFQKSLSASKIFSSYSKYIDSMNSSPNIINILIVDDNSFNILILQEILLGFKKCDLIIDKAFNGKIAFEKFCDKNDPTNDFYNKYHIIFIDFEMPIMDGIQATKMIREKICKEGFYDVIIVGCSGDHEKYEREGKIKELLVDECFGKPICKEDVISVLEKYRGRFKR